MTPPLFARDGKTVYNAEGFAFAHCSDEQEAEAITRALNAVPKMRAALQSVDLRLTQTRLASNIGRESSVKKADFLRGQCESIAQDVRAVLASLNQ